MLRDASQRGAAVAGLALASRCAAPQHEGAQPAPYDACRKSVTPLAVPSPAMTLVARPKPEARLFRRDEQRTALGVLHLCGPQPLDRGDDVGRYRHVVELLRHLAALGVGPLEEFQRIRGGWTARLLVHEDEGRTGNRPARGAGF